MLECLMELNNESIIDNPVLSDEFSVLANVAPPNLLRNILSPILSNFTPNSSKKAISRSVFLLKSLQRFDLLDNQSP